MPTFPNLSFISEGKTKQLYKDLEHPGCIITVSKNDITAGDGKKHDTFIGKANSANQTTCNVFRLLNRSGIPTAFIERVSSVSFRAKWCAMLPYEVVVRREAHGSYLKRSPHIEKGHFFEDPLVEFFLKTNNKRWKDYALLCDDPLMKVVEDTVELYDPKLPSGSKPFLILDTSEIFQNPKGDPFRMMEGIARHTFFLLEQAWQLQGGRLVDFKIEFGITDRGKGFLVVADVIDNDSWRVIWTDGKHIDKQVYRDGGSIEDVAAHYRMVAELTNYF